MESIPFDDPTDLVAITVEAYTARRASMKSPMNSVCVASP